MSDYKELVEELRDADQTNWKRLSLDAAAAIEDLQRELSLAEIAADDNGRQVVELQGELSEANTTVKAFKMEIEKLQAEVERYNTDRVAAGYPDIRWTDFNKVTCKETGNLTTTLQSLSNTEVQE